MGVSKSRAIATMATARASGVRLVIVPQALALKETARLDAVRAIILPVSVLPGTMPSVALPALAPKGSQKNNFPATTIAPPSGHSERSEESPVRRARPFAEFTLTKEGLRVTSGKLFFSRPSPTRTLQRFHFHPTTIFLANVS